jgi:retron-type reverse transcriptase
MLTGCVVRSEEGTPLSPLLANILLDDLDKALEKRGHKFVRDADDCNIYVKSERAGKRLMESITGFLEKQLRLKSTSTKARLTDLGKGSFSASRSPMKGPPESE